jgi:hypothetical protein
MRSILLCLIFASLVLKSGQADGDFEKEMFESGNAFIHAAMELGPEQVNVMDYVPTKAKKLIDYGKKFFLDKTFMRSKAPKV